MAQYSAAEARVKISETAHGVGEDMADLNLAMQRAEDKTEQMRARASDVEGLWSEMLELVTVAQRTGLRRRAGGVRGDPAAARHRFRGGAR